MVVIYTLKIFRGKTLVKKVEIVKGKTSYNVPNKILKKAGKYKFTLVAKGKGNYYNSVSAASKILKKK